MRAVKCDILGASEKELRNRRQWLLSERMRQRRQELGFSQQKLSERSGLTLSQIQKLEQGVIVDPHASTLTKLADALGLQV